MVLATVFLIAPFALRMMVGNTAIPSKILPQFFHSIVSPPAGAPLLSIIFVLLFVFLFNKLLRITAFDELQRTITVGIILFAPATIYLANTFSVHSFALPLASLALILIFSEKRTWAVLGVLLSAVLAIDPSVSLAASLLYFAFFSFSIRLRQRMIILATLSVVFLLRSLLSFPLPQFQTQLNVASSVISDFGAPAGISLAFALLSIAGFISTWRQVSRYITLYLSIAALLALVYFIDFHFIFYVVPLLAILAADMFVSLFFRQWHLEQIKKLSLLLVFCTFLFSAISFAKILALASPTANDISVLQELSKQDQGVVLSFPDNAKVIQAYGGAEPFYSYPFVLNESELSIFDRSGYYSAKSFLTENGIQYVYYSEDMVAQEKEYSLRTVLDSYGEFKRIARKGDAELWRVG